ncbi:MAG: hypothetical protein JKY56_15195 [Kofleriaceae bacterium]|nr:hypothetical protein [Kofleriaceae bacterium]
MVDTSAIHRVIAAARRRLKLQSAIEAATLAVIPASALAATTIVATRLGHVSESSAVPLLALSAALVVLGAIVGGMRRFSQNLVATKVDRSSDLSDRLATACAFEIKLAGDQTFDSETESMMRLAIDDATRAVNRADPKAATPFGKPRDGKAALAFALVAGLVSGISISPDENLPKLVELTPIAAPRDAVVVAVGRHFVVASEGIEPSVTMGEGENAITIVPSKASASEIVFRVPAEAKIGFTIITIRRGELSTQSLPFEVLDSKDPRAIPEDRIILEDEDLDYAKDLIAEIRKTAEANDDKALEELAKKLEQLIKDSEEGELTKKDLLLAIAKAEEKYMEGSEEALEESVADLKKAGKELKKEKLTKDLGKALEKGNLEQAKAEMEKLADKLDDNKLSEADQKKIGKAMEKAAEKMDKAQKKREESIQKNIEKKKDSIRKLEKKQKEARTEREREEAVRRLKKEKRELKRMQKRKEEQKKDGNKRELKQLRKKMSQAAKQLQKKQQNKKQQQKSRREVSKSMRDMAKSTGKVSQDKRKMANKAKVSSQMSDLKEAMRRAKRKGKKGGGSKFGRNRKRKDFSSRARGGKGKPGAWKPGQGKGQGQGQGQGNKPGGKEYGDGHDPNVMGKSTPKGGNITDESLQGVRGKGPSTRETILTAAKKGFASRSYKKVFARYKTIVEEDIKAEKVPSGYKYYVKRYFQKIKHQKSP